MARLGDLGGRPRPLRTPAGALGCSGLPAVPRRTPPADVLPSALAGDIRLDTLEIAGSKERVEEWIGVQLNDVFDGVRIEFTSPHGHPGLSAVVFDVPGRGLVRI